MSLPTRARSTGDQLGAAPDRRGAAAGKNRSPPANDRAVATSNGMVDGLQTHIIDSAAAFEQLQQRWSELHAVLPAANVFMSHEWLHTWWKAYAPPAALAIVLVEQHGHLIALAPMMIEQQVCAGVPHRVLHFIGDGTSETDHIDFLIEPSAAARATPPLLDALAALPWDVAAFNAMPDSSPNLARLKDWIARNRWFVSEQSVPCSVRRLPATFDQLLAELPARLRTGVRSTRRRLEQGHRVEFGLHERPDEIDEALTSLFANHTSRWQGKGKSGVFDNARKRSFYYQLTPRLLERGWLRFFYLKLDGRIVAQQYCFAVDGTVMLLQEGFDFAHAKDNVGNALRACVFEHLIASDAHCYDFLAGTSRHKASWSDGVINDISLGCGRRTWRGCLFFALPLAWRRLKDRLRPWRDRLRDAMLRGARGE